MIDDIEYYEKVKRIFKTENEYFRWVAEQYPGYKSMINSVIFYSHSKFDKYYDQISKMWKGEILNGDSTKEYKNAYLIREEDALRLIEYTNEVVTYFWIYDMYIHLTNDVENDWMKRGNWKYFKNLLPKNEFNI